jgi:hypothetical protein
MSLKKKELAKHIEELDERIKRLESEPRGIEYHYHFPFWGWNYYPCVAPQRIEPSGPTWRYEITTGSGTMNSMYDSKHIYMVNCSSACNAP